MKTKNLFGLLAFLVVGLVVTAGIVSAWGFGFREGFDSETREEIKAAIEAGDFDAWKEIMSSQLTEEHFAAVVERHKANQERFEQREAMRQALEDGDYETWKTLAENLPNRWGPAEVIDEEDFNLLVQLHQARIDGNTEKMQELREQLGDDFDMGKGFMPCGRHGALHHTPW